MGDSLWCHEIGIFRISLCIASLWSSGLFHFWQLASWSQFYCGSQSPKRYRQKRKKVRRHCLQLTGLQEAHPLSWSNLLFFLYPSSTGVRIQELPQPDSESDLSLPLSHCAHRQWGIPPIFLLNLLLPGPLPWCWPFSFHPDLQFPASSAFTHCTVKCTSSHVLFLGKNSSRLREGWGIWARWEEIPNS